jgi:dephospho-CoA kinase
MTKIIGLTGGIGSGKTTVAKCFIELGCPVYLADEGAREVMQSAGMIAAIKKEFGSQFFANDELDRKKLAAMVFNDENKLRALNELVHPAVALHFSNWLRQQQAFPFVIREAAILFESGSYKDCDKIITVTAPVEVRLQRVMARDKITREQVMERMNNQWSDALKIAKSDYVIENIDMAHVREIVGQIFQTLKKL